MFVFLKVPFHKHSWEIQIYFLYYEALKLFSRCDIVVDVGGEFDPAKKRFDHHQRSFTHSFSSLKPEKTQWSIKLSSAGLVYVHYGMQVIEQILQKLTKSEKIDQNLVAIIYDKMYENFVKEIDAIDNGVEISETKAYSINTNLSARVSFLNPEWNETDKNEDSQFKLALEMGKEMIILSFSFCFLIKNIKIFLKFLLILVLMYH